VQKNGHLADEQWPNFLIRDRPSWGKRSPLGAHERITSRRYLILGNAHHDPCQRLHEDLELMVAFLIRVEAPLNQRDPEKGLEITALHN
jgi:hypothetical protein